jgi:hypothetical protein
MERRDQSASAIGGVLSVRALASHLHVAANRYRPGGSRSVGESSAEEVRERIKAGMPGAGLEIELGRETAGNRLKAVFSRGAAGTAENSNGATGFAGYRKGVNGLRCLNNSKKTSCPRLPAAPRLQN